MHEGVLPAPPVLPVDHANDNGSSVCIPAGDSKTDVKAPNGRALFAPTSMRSEFVSAYPELDQVCDQLGFGMEMSIGQWNADPSWALLALARAAEPPLPAPTFDWSQAEIFELIDNLICHHHNPLRNELRRLALLIRNFDRRYPVIRDLDFNGSFTKLEINLVGHLDQEEQTVFPHCLANEAESRGHGTGVNDAAEVTTGIRDMMSGHNYGSEELSHMIAQVDAAMRMVVDEDLDVIRVALTAIAADLVVHAEKERDILMPAALSSEEQLRSKSGAHRIIAPRPGPLIDDASSAPSTPA
jgi:iron-sulfur cluster repair protein YtfE (RIC family)